MADRGERSDISPLRSFSFASLLKPVLLALVFAIDIVTWPPLIQEMGLPGFVRVALVFFLLAFATLCAAWTAWSPLRWFYALLLGMGALLVLGYRFSVGQEASYFTFATTIDARSAWRDALPMYGGDLLWAALASLLTVLAVGLRPRRWPLGLGSGWRATLLALVPLVAAIAFSTLLYARAGQVRGVPSSWQGLGYAALYTVDAATGVTGEREQPSLPLVKDRARGDIVLIVDESVSGNYLDLNAPGGARSGLAEERPGWRIHDYGIASSIANCSMQTNVALRFGAQADDFRERVAKGASLWAYARKAGYHTVYLYGQRGGMNENFMTDAERADIDEQHYLDDVPIGERDHRLAAMIAKKLSDDRPDFIMVNKAGTHFPLTGLYPEGKGRFAGEIDTTSGRQDAAYWRGYANNYRNAVDWSVGGFFDRIFAEARGERPATLIYTSDHGQTFYEHGTPGSATHCHSDPAMEEGAVPLVLIERGLGNANGQEKANGQGKGRGDGAIDWAAAIDARHDGTSQFRIFPSLLVAMGYDRAAVAKAYGPDLGRAGRDAMRFAAEMQVRLGPPPRWVTVDPDALFRPRQ